MLKYADKNGTTVFELMQDMISLYNPVNKLPAIRSRGMQNVIEAIDTLLEIGGDDDSGSLLSVITHTAFKTTKSTKKLIKKMGRQINKAVAQARDKS